MTSGSMHFDDGTSSTWYSCLGGTGNRWMRYDVNIEGGWTTDDDSDTTGTWWRDDPDSNQAGTWSFMD